MAAILKLKMAATLFHVIITILVFNYFLGITNCRLGIDNCFKTVNYVQSAWDFYNGGHFDIQNGSHPGNEKNVTIGCHN